jgi:hypothetical protein
MPRLQADNKSANVLLILMSNPKISLRSLNIPATMDTSDFDLTCDFFIPILKKATRYDRGVGYFSSGWLKDNAQGLAAFAQRSGQARWITSPILDLDDWEALQTGDAARHDPILLAALSQVVRDLATALDRDTLSALAWMVADEILTFKLAVPRNKLDRGNFHDKFGVFTDAEDIAVLRRS